MGWRRALLMVDPEHASKAADSKATQLNPSCDIHKEMLEQIQ